MRWMRININCFFHDDSDGWKIGAVRLHIVSKKAWAVRAYVQPPSLLFKATV